MEDFYRISDVAEKVGKHVNTVDGWFKRMEEEERLHYINRVGGEKTYNTDDLNLALYIKEKREHKWSFDGIFNYLRQGQTDIPLRPFPEGAGEEDTAELIDVAALKHEMYREMENMAREMAKEQVQEVQEQYEALRKQLPDPEQERQNRINDLFTRRRVEQKLEEEALEKWREKPEEERMKRVGWFRKEEDRDKRELFVKDYVNNRFEERVLEEYGEEQ